MSISNKIILFIIICIAISLTSCTHCKNSNPQIPSDIPSKVRSNLKDLFSCNYKTYSDAKKRLVEMNEKEIATAIPFLIKLLKSNSNVYLKEPKWAKNSCTLDSCTLDTCTTLPAYCILATAYGECCLSILKPPALKYHSSKIRSHKDIAINILTAIDSNIAVEPLIKEVIGANRYIIKKRVIDTLKKIGDPLAVELLLKEVTEYSLNKKEAIKALKEFNDIRAVEPLIEELKKESPHKLEVVEALKELKDIRAVEPLINELKKDMPHKLAVIETLKDFRDTRAVKPLINELSKDSPYKIAIIEALKELGDTGAVEPLIIELKKDTFYKLDVIKALGELGDTRAVEPLMSELKKDSPHKLALAEALGKLRDTRALEVLFTMLKNAMKDNKDNKYKLKILLAITRIVKPFTKDAIAIRRNIDFTANEWLEWWENSKDRYIK